jgi:hypothetical protein
MVGSPYAGCPIRRSPGHSLLARSRLAGTLRRGASLVRLDLESSCISTDLAYRPNPLRGSADSQRLQPGPRFRARARLIRPSVHRPICMGRFATPLSCPLQSSIVSSLAPALSRASVPCRGFCPRRDDLAIVALGLPVQGFDPSTKRCLLVAGHCLLAVDSAPLTDFRRLPRSSASTSRPCSSRRSPVLPRFDPASGGLPLLRFPPLGSPVSVPGCPGPPMTLSRRSSTSADRARSPPAYRTVAGWLAVSGLPTHSRFEAIPPLAWVTWLPSRFDRRSGNRASSACRVGRRLCSGSSRCRCRADRTRSGSHNPS